MSRLSLETELSVWVLRYKKLHLDLRDEDVEDCLVDDDYSGNGHLFITVEDACQFFKKKLKKRW